MAKLESVTTLLALVILSLSLLQTAMAVDFLFWDGPSCSGVVDALCSSISNNTCCVSPAAYQSVQVRAADACQLTTVYQDSGCATNISANSSSICFSNDLPIYTSASWDSFCVNGIPIVNISAPAVNETSLSPAPAPAPVSGARRLLSDLRSGEANPTLGCIRHVEVEDNVIYYRESPSKGIWSLRSSEGASTAELLELLSSVPEDERVFWLLAQGAAYDFESEGEIRSIVHA
ncbi:hypothetical protein Mapa_005136 [Marchantia paleacea]|nr:hypothetical protein Mapa_005136 [Marchantia paleacea]